MSKINSHSVNTTINPSNDPWFQIVRYFCKVQKRLVHKAEITLFCAVTFKLLRKDRIPLCTVIYKKVEVADVGGHDIKASCNSRQCFQSALFIIAVLIDAIVKNGSSASARADHVPPPPGWRDEDIGRSETFVSSDEKKTYTEEQRQGVTRCKICTLFHYNRLTVCS